MANRSKSTLTPWALVIPCWLLACAGTGSQTSPQSTRDGGPLDSSPHPVDAARADGVTPDGTPGACRNLQCQQVICPDGGTTTLTGTVYAPNGTLPLFNALVYVPNAPVPAVAPGLACDRCGAVAPGQPLVNALTDTHGVFTLTDVAVGNNIPLVIQIGKWRRQIVVPQVKACQVNQLTDPDQTRLPRNRSEGDMPRIAITTGPCDNLICLMPKLGIDPSEWGIDGEDKAVTFFHGASYDADTDNTRLARLFDSHLVQMTSATTLWSNLSALQKYDLTIVSCECEALTGTAAEYQAVTQYLAMGGRFFSTDLQYVWYEHSSDANLSGSARFLNDNSFVGLNPITLDTTFPKGAAFSDWLSFVDPAGTPGQVNAYQVFDNFSGVTAPAWTTWGTSISQSDDVTIHPRLISVNTPVGAAEAQQCGRAVHLDAHISPTSSSTLSSVFPDSCDATLQNSEQAMVFFLFDVAACIQDDLKPIVAPPIVP
jgi:hypothetical protein